MLNIIQNIPNIKTYPLTYVFEHIELRHKPNTLWLEFGVASGKTINYISKFTKIKYMDLIVLKDWLKSGVMVLIKEHFQETVNKVNYEWIGMNGTPTGMSGYYHENVALIIHSIN